MLLHFLLFLPFIILKISQFETIYKDATQHHLFAVVYCVVKDKTPSNNLNKYVLTITFIHVTGRY